MSATLITPLDVGRRTHAPAAPTRPSHAAPAPRAALCLRTLANRAVVWVCVSDADPEPMRGQVDMPEASGREAASIAFVAALPKIAARIQPWLTQLANSSEQAVLLTVPNGQMRNHMRSAPMDGVIVLPSAELTDSDPVVGAAVEMIDQMHLELLCPDPVGIVEVAVGASVRARHRAGRTGICWVRQDGIYETQSTDDKDRPAALLRAITMAVRAHKAHRGVLSIVCEDAQTVALARTALAGDVDAYSDHLERRRAQRSLSMASVKGKVRVRRSGQAALRAGARRVALLARRDDEVGISGPTHELRASAALADELAHPGGRS